MSKLICALAACLAIGLIAAGCGDDDNGDGETLTEQEYIAQADANCKKADKELEAAEPQSQGELDKFVTDDLVPNIQGQIDYIRGLNGPQELESQVNPILDEAQRGIDQLVEEPSQIEGGPGGRKLQKAGNELGQVGFEKCGG